MADAERKIAKKLDQSGVAFSSIEPTSAGDGLLLRLPSGVDHDSASAKAATASSIPIHTESGAVAHYADRYADIQPYWGGDLIYRQVSGGHYYCTGGFGVISQTSHHYMLTAAHSASGGTGTYYTGDGTKMGSVAGWSGDNDAMVIDTNTAGFIYGGSYYGNPSGQTAIAVNGEGGSAVGESMCTSGAFSGQRCSVIVKATNLTIRMCDNNGQNCVTVSDEVRAEQSNYTNAGGNGDSGGPVYHAQSGGANAAGTLSAYDPTTEVACTGDPTSSTRKCGWRIYYPDILNELNDFGYTVAVP